MQNYGKKRFICDSFIVETRRSVVLYCEIILQERPYNRDLHELPLHDYIGAIVRDLRG